MTQKKADILPPGNVRKIVVVRLYGLGNFVLSLPLIEALPTLYPRARIMLLVDSRCAQVAHMAMPRRRIVTIDPSFDAGNWFAEEKPDLCLIAYPCADAGIVKAATAHSGTCVAHRVGQNQNLASLELCADADRHETELNLDLVRALGQEVIFSHPAIRPTAKAHTKADQLICRKKIKEPFIAFHPGCFGDLAIKRWPPAYYGKLADLLAEEGFGVVLVGGPDETELAEPIMDSSNVPIVNLIGETTLPEVTALLQKARMIVANDTGLMHLAAAVGTAVVGIYGPTSHTKNTPLGEHRLVRRPVSCSPCYKPGRPFPVCRAWCLEMTTPEQVHTACTKLLEGKKYANKPAATPFVSVIVPTYNGEKKIGRLLRSLTGQSYPREKYEIICVDNNSSDSTRREIQKHAGIRYEFYAEKQTSYAARNHGISKARGEVLAFTDDDCEADPDWIANAVQWFEHPQVGGVAGKVVGAESDNDIARWQSRRGFLDLHPDIETSKRPAIVTANVFYRREVFDCVGAFQEDMVSSGDHEMAWRMIAGGEYVFRAAPDAVVHHYHRQTLKSLAKTFFRYGYGHVDLDRRFPNDDHSPLRRLGDAAKTWKGLAKQGADFVANGTGPSAVPGLRDENPEEFFRRCSHLSKGFLLTAKGMEESAILKTARKNGMEIVLLPLPPSVEYLEAQMRTIAREKLTGLFLYAAGQHTRRLMTRPGFEALGAQGIIDDNAGPDQRMGPLPVITLDEALRRKCQNILISTDAFEHVLLKKLAPLEQKGVRIHGLYDETAWRRLAGQEARAMADASSEAKALLIPENLLPEKLAVVVAKEAGIFIRLDERSNSRYSDPFLDWVITVAKRTGRIAGSIRYRHLYV